MIGMKVEGRKTFLDLQIAGKQFDETLRNTIKDTAREYRDRLRVALSGTGSGKEYGARKGRIYKRTRKTAVIFGKSRAYTGITAVATPTIAYRASEPGQSPAKRTGNLIRSVSVVRSRAYSANVGMEKKIAFYRHMLEFGTKERFQRDYSKDVRVAGKRRGTTKLIKGKGKSVGKLEARPVLPAIQAQLNADLERRVLRAADLFVAFHG